MNISDTPDEASFRAEVRSWFQEHFAAHFGSVRRTGPYPVDALRSWSRMLHDAGFAGLTWPREFGGAGASYARQAIFVEEQARAGAPPHLGVVGLGMSGPTVIVHGSPEQQDRYLRPILTGEEIWCQGFSEPGSGSDVAAARTSATPTSEGWLVNGQKVWSSFAHIADFCILLVRTDPTAPKHRGLTMLLVDMRTPGIDVRPLRQITGDSEFNEIFFVDVEVPGSAVIGEVGQGWQVALTTLMHERGTATFGLTAQLEQALREVTDLARSTGRLDDPLFADRLAANWIDLQAIRYTNYRALTDLQRTGTPGPEGSISKLVWSERNQDLTSIAQELRGLAAQLDDKDVPDSFWTYQQLRSRGNTIGGGTSQVLKNIISERVLGLPRSR